MTVKFDVMNNIDWNKFTGALGISQNELKRFCKVISELQKEERIEPPEVSDDSN